MFDIFRYIRIVFDISERFWAQFGHSFDSACREIVNFTSLCPAGTPDGSRGEGGIFLWDSIAVLC